MNFSRSILIMLALMMTVPSFAATDSTQTKKPIVTFVELGSVTCIPCKEMQPVMKAIETKYGEQVKVVFYDVKQEANKQIAKDYKVKMIPTQVFLDQKGVEFHRHVGFYPEKEIDKVLQTKGIQPLTKKD